MTRAGLTLGTGESLRTDNDEVVTLGSTARDGEIYNIVGSFKQGAVDVEEVKTYNPANLKDAIGDISKERAEIEKEKAKDVLRTMLERKDAIEYNLRTIQAELTAINRELNVFYKKAPTPKTPKK